MPLVRKHEFSLDQGQAARVLGDSGLAHEVRGCVGSKVGSTVLCSIGSRAGSVSRERVVASEPVRGGEHEDGEERATRGRGVRAARESVCERYQAVRS